MAEPKIKAFDPVGNGACMVTLACWCVGPIFIKYLTDYLDPWTQNFVRYIAACLFWLPVLVFYIKTKRFDHRIWKKAIMPTIANIFMQTLWAWAFYFIAPAFASLLVKTSIIWVVIFSFIWFPEERALFKSIHFWAGLILSAIGVTGVMLYQAGISEKNSIIGTVLIMLCGLTWGIYTVYIKIAFKDIDKRLGFSVISLYMVAALGLLAFVFGKPSQCLDLPASAWMAVIISGITGIGLGHVFYYVAVHRLGATIPSLLLLSQPFIVLAVSNMVFKESLTAIQLLFGLVLLTGSALAIWAQRYLIEEPPR